MDARRSLWIWWGAGVFFLLLLAGWVFRASLNEQRKPISSFGTNGFENPANGGYASQRNVNPNTASVDTGLDPRIQDTLRTINEVNRINRMNQELRKNSPLTPQKTALPPSPDHKIDVRPNAIPQEETETPSTTR